MRSEPLIALILVVSCWAILWMVVRIIGLDDDDPNP